MTNPTPTPEDLGYYRNARGVWQRDVPAENFVPAAEQSAKIRRDSADTLNQQQQSSDDKAANHIRAIYFKQLEIDKAKAEKAARLAQERLDELTADPEVTGGKLSRRLTPAKDYEAGQLRPLTEEEVQQLKQFKANADRAKSKQREEYVRNQHKQQRYGDDAARENLLRLISGMSKEQKALFNKELGL